MKTSFSSIKSHPDKPLIEHLYNVGKYSRDIVSTKNIDIGIDREILKEIVYLVGIGHDIGKATKYFQEYINEKDEKKKKILKAREETHHALISAIFVYYIIKEYLRTANLENEEYYKYLPILCFVVVKRHHGNLKNVLDEISDLKRENTKNLLKKQIEDLNFAFIREILGNLGYLNIDEFIHSFKQKFEVCCKKCRGREFKWLSLYEDFRGEKKLVGVLEEKNDLIYYFITLFLFSILLDADKMDAAGLEKIGRFDLDESIVDKYKKIRFTGDVEGSKKYINRLRDEIYEKVVSQVNKLDIDKEKIMSLNLPTGTGKTLTSLSFALKLRQRLEEEKGYKPRIIYSLPFLAIIDQNFSVYEDMFKTVTRNIPTSDIILKHHHLSDIVFTRRQRNDETTDDAGTDLLLIEAWNSEIIVTTFIQFFHSLFSNKNSAIRKIHNIVNSIVILDEIQAIPYKYWKLMRETIKTFSEQFNTYFIFVTATQPLIFNEEKQEIISIVENKETYFKKLNRIKLLVDLEPIPVKEFEKKLEKEIISSPTKNILVVLNTINVAKRIYNFIERMNLDNTELYYLSTELIPKERLKRIEKIKKKSVKRKIIVSTQLIEAGVDIDVDIVYRDFSPLDSINQVSGRCNRNFDSNCGIVKVFILKDDGNSCQGGQKRNIYAYRIYEGFILSKTKEVFSEINKRELYEKNFLNLNKTYFEKISLGKSDDKSKEKLDSVKTLKFADIAEKFKLIENEYPEQDIFVEIDERAEKIWNKYMEICSISDPIKRKKEFLKIKKWFYEYVISVPLDYSRNIEFNKEAGIGYISKIKIDNGCEYSYDTGFERTKNKNNILFIG